MEFIFEIQPLGDCRIIFDNFLHKDCYWAISSAAQRTKRQVSSTLFTAVELQGKHLLKGILHAKVSIDVNAVYPLHCVLATHNRFHYHCASSYKGERSSTLYTTNLWVRASQQRTTTVHSAAMLDSDPGQGLACAVQMKLRTTPS